MIKSIKVQDTYTLVGDDDDGLGRDYSGDEDVDSFHHDPYSEFGVRHRPTRRPLGFGPV